MFENLVDLFTELSREIVKHELEIGNEEFERGRRAGALNKCIRKLCRKCFDILLLYQHEVDLTDPCVTEYGAEWSPSILLMDYGEEIARRHSEQSRIRLTTCINVIESKSYYFQNELFKLILLLRDSSYSVNDELKPNFLSTVSQYSLKKASPLSLLQNDHSNLTIRAPLESLNAKNSTNLFESGCQLLQNLNDRTTACDRSLEHLVSEHNGKINVNDVNPSISNFSVKNKENINDNFLYVAKNVSTSDNLLLRRFAEKSNWHKFKDISPLMDISAVSDGSRECDNRLMCQNSEINLVQSNSDNHLTALVDNGENMNYDVLKSSCHIYSSSKDNNILYPLFSKNMLDLNNYESCFVKRLKLKRKLQNRSKNSFFESSSNIILALWEQEFRFKYLYEEEPDLNIPQLRILELNKFLKDIQFLLVGVTTDTFNIDEENMCFIMNQDTCLEGVTPTTLVRFSKEFLEVGNCYLRLSQYIELCLKRQIITNFNDCKIISKVFWMSVYDYLCRHSQYVLRIPLSLGLLEFNACAKNLYPIIHTVSEFCKILENNRSVPQGGQLLTDLFHFTQRITNKQTAAVFFGFLKSCCETYLVNLLQDWIFQGHVERHYTDFFVEHRPKNPRHKDRSYYLSFSKVNDRVPLFLKGLDNKIFNCGKTIHLLKLIQPESKLCRFLETRAYPKIKLCLSEAELEDQRKVFEEYANNVSKICGEFASVIKLKQEEIAREQSYEKFILDVKREEENKREIQKKESMELLRLKREQQNLQLSKQIRIVEEEKMRKRKREELENKMALEDAKKIADAEKRVLEEEKLATKVYYEELMQQLEKRAESIQRTKQVNEGSPSPTECNVSSVINDNAVMNETDREGNIIESVDLDVVNSNPSPLTLNYIMEDVENENASETQLQELIRSRIDYQEIYLKRSEAKEVLITSNSTTECAIVEESPKNVEKEGKKKSNKKTLGFEYDCSKTQQGKHKKKLNKKHINGSEEENAIFEKKNCFTSASDIKLKKPGIGSQVQNIVKRLMKGDRDVSEIQEMSPEKKTKANVVFKTNNNKMEENKRKLKTETRSNKKKDDSSQCKPCTTGSNQEEVHLPKVETEAEKNKKKMMASEFGMRSEVKQTERAVVESEAEKNKKKIMSSEYGSDPQMKMAATWLKATAETEAEKIKRKVMAAEYGTNVEVEEVKKTSVETEAEKNKKKIMASEFGSESKLKIVKKTAVETEAEKNKKKIMASEFGTEPEVKELKTVMVETEAQKNKRKVMNREFNEVENACLVRRALSEEAKKNKEKVLGIEFGHEKQPVSKKECGDKQRGCSDEKDYYSGYDDVVIYDEESEAIPFMKTSLTEKTLRIFNKKKSMESDLRFFTLQECCSNLSLSTVNYPWLSNNGVRVVFEKHLHKPLAEAAVTSEFQNMTITKFLNYVRGSVLISLRVQEEIANGALLNHLLKHENLLLHFKALRNYFFLNDGEFSRRLTQNIFATLANCTEPHQFFKRSTLNNIVYEALNFTIHSNEPCIKNVSFEIVTMPTFLSHASHDVLYPFELSYQVRWPLNIILTEKALSKYKRVFHFLLKLKRINWTLNENFSHLKYTCRDSRINSRLLLNSPNYHKMHVYRHAMGQFMRTLENYISSCSLQFSWLTFQKELDSVKNLDDLYDKHVNYVKDVLKRCFLTSESKELESYINNLIELSLKYHYSTKTGKWVRMDDKYVHTKFDSLKSTFHEFCGLTTEFMRTLRKKIGVHQDLKPHEILMEKFDLIL